MRITSEQKKWQRNGKGYAKTDVRFLEGGSLQAKYTEAGRRIESRNWAVRIQHQGRRQSFSLETPNQAAAAAKSKEIFSRARLRVILKRFRAGPASGIVFESLTR